MSTTDTTAARSERVERLRESLRERELDALLVNNLTDVRYLTGFSGSNALAVIRAVERTNGERASGERANGERASTVGPAAAVGSGLGSRATPIMTH